MRALIYILKVPAKALDSLADRVCAILGAALFCQVPGFIGHYLQRLGGHVAEAQRNVDTWREIADKTANGSLTALAEQYLASDVATTIETGRKCLADVGRLETLIQGLEAIQTAPSLAQGLVFLRRLDFARVVDRSIF